MPFAPVDHVRVVVLAPDPEVATAVHEVLTAEQVLEVPWRPDRQAEAGRPSVDPDLLILQTDGLDIPALVRRGYDEGWLRLRVPVIVLAPRPVEREDQRAWLAAGAWAIVRLPFDQEIFRLELRNLLRGYPAGIWAHAEDEPYTRDALLRVTEENLALAGRYGRPLSAAAFCLSWGSRRSDQDALTLMRRLAGPAREAVRGSDLVGVTAQGTLVVLLPDTDAAGAAVFAERLVPELERRLRAWGFVGRITSAQVSAKLDPPIAPETFLSLADRAVA